MELFGWLGGVMVLFGITVLIIEIERNRDE